MIPTEQTWILFYSEFSLSPNNHFEAPVEEVVGFQVFEMSKELPNGQSS